MAVFVLGKRKRPLMPCTEKRARLLLERGRAVVHRHTPFTIRLKDRVGGKTQPLRIKIDPGSKATGVALVREGSTGQAVLNLFELLHRGQQIRKALEQRRACRRRRRNQLRYRPARFSNRTKPRGWLAPSLQHRVDTTASWVARIQRLAPIKGVTQELVRFDTQAMESPEISGAEYQQGELAGFEVREYLLEKWGRQCAYCDAQSVPLQTEHIHPRAKGGSDRVSNLTLACGPCNQKKDCQSPGDFLAHDPMRAEWILRQAKRPLHDAAAVNATRWALYGALKETGLPVEVGTGGRTKWNRSRLGVPKSHALDAACAGAVDSLTDWQRPTLQIKCTGRGSYKRTRLDRFGFPRGYLLRTKSVHGFQTGDYVRADVPTGAKAGTLAEFSMKKQFVISSLMALFLIACSAENAKPLKVVAGNGIYISARMGSDLWENIPSDYQRSEECESNEFYIDSRQKCVIGIDLDEQISSGLVIHRTLMEESAGKKFYRLFVSEPDGTVIDKRLTF